MKTLTLTRTKTGDQGTFGKLEADGLSVFTGELPWRDNETGKSSIPAGTYRATLIDSPKHGPCYLLQNVPSRGDVEIHSANWMGDASKGYRCQLLGCIALGMSVGWLANQMACVSSVEAVGQFMEWASGDEIKLTIVEDYAATQ